VADLELLLIHEEPRRIIGTGHISYYGQLYRISDRDMSGEFGQC
jgi:hypothetical protein